MQPPGQEFKERQGLKALPVSGPLFDTRDMPALTAGPRFQHVESGCEMGAHAGLGQQPLVMTPRTRIHVGHAAQPDAQ
jgi:hypothetical protein